MRWSPMGAHALLQVRAELVDVLHLPAGILGLQERDSVIRLAHDPTV